MRAEEIELLLSRLRRRFTAFAALALVLLLAQAGAIGHGYTHLSRGDPVGVGTNASQICLECLSSTPLLSAAGAPDTVVLFHPLCEDEAPGTASSSSSERRPAPAFQSRAPPYLV